MWAGASRCPRVGDEKIPPQACILTRHHPTNAPAPRPSGSTQAGEQPGLAARRATHGPQTGLRQHGGANPQVNYMNGHRLRSRVPVNVACGAPISRSCRVIISGQNWTICVLIRRATLAGS